MGSDFIVHVRTRHGFDIKHTKFLVHFETRNVYPFVSLRYCKVCGLRTSDNGFLLDHKKSCLTPPELHTGPKTPICDANFDKFLKSCSEKLIWVKTDMMGKRPRAATPASWQGDDDRITMAGDDESLRGETTEEYDIVSPTTGPSTAPSESGDPTTDQAVANVSAELAVASFVEPEPIEQDVKPRIGRGRGYVAIKSEVTTSRTLALYAPNTQPNPYLPPVKAEPFPTRPSEIISEQCMLTGHDVAGIGDLLPVRRQMRLTVQRLYFEEIPLPGMYFLCRENRRYARMTVSPFPQNIHYRRHGKQEHDPSDLYVAHVWMLASIPSTMTAWVTVDVAIDDGRYDVIEQAPNAIPTYLTVSSEFGFLD